MNNDINYHWINSGIVILNDLKEVYSLFFLLKLFCKYHPIFNVFLFLI